MNDFEIYEGRTAKQNRKKTYLVFPFETDIKEVVATAKRHFRCTAGHLNLMMGWVMNDELYLENPHKRGMKLVAIATYIF